jgi:membrane protein DedA with SNARE-associated domain
MKRRLYFMLPDLAESRAMLDELLLARIEQRYIHFCAKEGSLPSDMPEANVFQKTGLIHGIETGMLIGAISGLLAGSALMAIPPENLEMHLLALLVAVIGGAIIGSWISGFSARAIPNSKLKPFRDDIEKGQVLLIVDVPFDRVTEIKNMIARHHPEVSFGGAETHTLSFT